MPWQLNDRALATIDLDTIQQVARVEDLLLLSQYEDAVSQSLQLVSRLEDGPDELLQRALVGAIQAHTLCGRHEEAEDMVSKIGLCRLATPTFMAWVLLLLESGQAAVARRHVENYMACLAAVDMPRGSDTQQLPPTSPRATIPASSCQTQAVSQQPANNKAAPCATNGLRSFAIKAEIYADGSDETLESSAPSGVGTQPGTGILSACRTPSCRTSASAKGMPTATLEDRAALARLYSQDVLTLGLRASQEALRWLQLDAQQGVAGTQSGAGTAVVTVRELLGGCEEMLSGLRRELEEVALAAGLVPGADSSSITSTKNDSVQNGKQQRNSTNVAAAVSHESTMGVSSTTAVVAEAKPKAAVPAHGLGAAGNDGSVFSRGMGGHGVDYAAAVSSLARPSGLTASTPLSWLGVFGMVQSWLTAAVNALRRLTAVASVQLTRTQAWVLCQAATAVKGLRGEVGAGSSSLCCFFLRSGSSSNVLLALAAGAVVLVAATAEAPHLRSALAGQWARLAGMAREALLMGLALHPSPVATVTAAVP